MSRLHVGSGTWYADTWVNVDICDPGPGFRPPDVIASVFDLPFPANSFSKIYCGHFFEHLAWDDIPAALDELHRVATDKCKMAVVGPAYDLATQQGQPKWLLDSIIEHDPPPGGHAWTATVAKTREALERGGMKVMQVDISAIAKPDWCNPNSWAEWQCAFLAKWPTL